METYNRNTKEKLKEFQRCVTARWEKLRQQHIEKRDQMLLKTLKPLRRVINSDYTYAYVQGVNVKQYDKLEMY